MIQLLRSRILNYNNHEIKIVEMQLGLIKGFDWDIERSWKEEESCQNIDLKHFRLEDSNK